MNVELQSHPDGVVLPVRAQPKARRSAITGEHAGALKVSVTAPAEKGKANAAIIAVLAKEFGLAKSQIELLSGQTSSQKRFLLRGESMADVAAKIAARLGEDR